MKLRLTEIDFMRGVAVLFMVLFHALFIGMLFDFWQLNLFEGGWQVFGLIVRWTFLLLVGVSLVLSRRDFVGQLRRSGFVFFLAMLVTIATWLVFPNEFVKFGVLHLIAVSIPVVFLFKKVSLKWIVGLGVFFNFMGPMLRLVIVDNEWLFPLGIRYWGFSSLDYFPIFPWLGVVLLGLGLGKFLYLPAADGGGDYAKVLGIDFVFGEVHVKRVRGVLGRAKWILWMGKRALLIYMLHFPILYFSFLGVESLVF
jgi:uncharacterized membrane protein